MKAEVKKRLDLACDKGKEFEEALKKLESASKVERVSEILEVLQDLNDDLDHLYGKLVKK